MLPSSQTHLPRFDLVEEPKRDFLGRKLSARLIVYRPQGSCIGRTALGVQKMNSLKIPDSARCFSRSALCTITR
ncbi:hypothetical protein PM082_002188 [Marasmius tenuissimus]|nr:hypothetical protein PM082_002188 [Marasmius tenuissimus]